MKFPRIGTVVLDKDLKGNCVVCHELHPDTSVEVQVSITGREDFKVEAHHFCIRGLTSRQVLQAVMIKA